MHVILSLIVVSIKPPHLCISLCSPPHGLSVALLSVLSCYLSKCFLQALLSSLGHVVELALCCIHGVLFSHSFTIVNWLETICQTWEGGGRKGEKTTTKSGPWCGPRHWTIHWTDKLMVSLIAAIQAIKTNIIQIAQLSANWKTFSNLYTSLGMLEAISVPWLFHIHHFLWQVNRTWEVVIQCGAYE